MKKEIIILSDVEMGAGTLTDDFIADNTLMQLIIKLSKKKHAVDLIFNGDTFDFLKSPYKLKPARYTRHVTKEVAVDKLKLAYAAHKDVFDVLRAFVAHDNKTIYFIRGNHDLELAFPAVKHHLQKLLNSKDRVKFPGLFYRHNGLYVEHGQQYDTGNFLPPKELFLTHQGKKILNNTFTAFGVISSMIPMKEKHPFFERIKPWPLMMTLHKPIGKEVNRTVIKYFLKGLFYYPIRYYTDPTHSFPRSLIREFLWRARQWNWEIQDIVPLVKRKKRDKIIVLGH
jgi:UDP-2,3-diacylglucosamine pyrophosphatase LpxH